MVLRSIAPIKDFLSRRAARRLWLEQLPGYAPRLNPDQGLWNYLKRLDLANGCCPTLTVVSTDLLRARARLRHNRPSIRTCFSHCRLALSLLMPVSVSPASLMSCFRRPPNAPANITA